jgi:hypothetical protein
MSGYNDASTPNEYHTLRKPVPYDELHDVIERSLKAGPLMDTNERNG